MIKKFNDYDKTQAYGSFQTLPKGGYVLQIKNVEVCAGYNGGEYLKIAIDIVEGEYANYFMNDWSNQQSEDKKWRGNYLLNIPKDDGSEQDGWTKRKFKTFTEALEDSNEGYHFDWDETKFKGKLIGGLFNEREYEANNGEIRRATNLGAVTSVEKVRSGDYKLPNDRILNRTATVAPSDDFIKIPDNIDEELPFK